MDREVHDRTPRPEALFSGYAYFSSYSDTWLRHAETYVEAITPRVGLGEDSLVLELASKLRIHVRHAEDDSRPITSRVERPGKRVSS